MASAESMNTQLQLCSTPSAKLTEPCPFAFQHLMRVPSIVLLPAQ